MNVSYFHSFVCVALSTYIIIVRYLHSYLVQRLSRGASTYDIAAAFGARWFVWMNRKGLEIGLLRTYGIPSISKLLLSTKEITDKVGKRYDDTDILVSEFLFNPDDSTRHKTALARMNQMHSKYSISNEDFLYVLTCFYVPAIRLIRKYGFRQPTVAEEEALVQRWLYIAQSMGIQGAFTNYKEAEEYQEAYEAKHMVYAECNKKVADATLGLFLTQAPRFLHLVVKPLLFAVLDDRLKAAVGWPSSPVWLQGLAHAILWCRACFMYWLVPPLWCLSWHHRCSAPDTAPANGRYPFKVLFENSYPQGYKIEEVGPVSFPPLKCPFAA